MKRILVTAIGGQVGHGILKCLDGYDGEIFGTDINDYPAGIDRVVSFRKVPFAIDPQFIPTIMQLCEDKGITHLMELLTK